MCCTCCACCACSTATVNNQFGLGIKSDGTYANSVFVNPIDVQVNANCVVHAINYPMVPEGSTNNVANNPVPLPNPASGSVPALLARNGRLSRSLALYQRFLPSWSSREIQQGTQIGMFFVTVDDVRAPCTSHSPLSRSLFCTPYPC